MSSQPTFSCGEGKGRDHNRSTPARKAGSGAPRWSGGYHPVGDATIAEIDSPHLRDRCRVNRRAPLILSVSLPIDVNAWEFAGNRSGNIVGMWALDWISLRAATESSSRPIKT